LLVTIVSIVGNNCIDIVSSNCALLFTEGLLSGEVWASI